MLKIIKADFRNVAVISHFTEKSSNTISRGQDEIRSLFNNFFMLANEKEFVGCGGWKRWRTDAEIVAFFIEDNYRRQGLAIEMLSACIEDIKNHSEIKRIFALATSEVAQRVFLPNEFQKVGIQLFNWKILKDCRKCLKNCVRDGKYLCDEVALLYVGK